MTRSADGNTAYISMNGDNTDTSIVEVSLNPSDGTLINMGTLDIEEAYPHGHWMNNDIMVTPNAFTGTSSIYEFSTGDTTVIPDTTLLGVSTNAFGVPIATGMHPSGEKYYVANLLDQTVTCVSIGAAACNVDTDEDGYADQQVATKHIVLVAGLPNLFNAGELAVTQYGAAGLLPIQTPVDPSGKYVVTATLLPSIVIIDTEIDEMVLSLACDAGCHGVNFGANVEDGTGSGYNAYVSSKFSNALIVFDPKDAVDADANRDGILDATESVGVVGRIILADDNASANPNYDGTPSGLHGMGGQGVLAIPNPYDGWIEATVDSDNLSSEMQGWIDQLSDAQKDPYP